MTSKKSLITLIVALLAMVFVTSGCERSYAPAADGGKQAQATPTVNAESAFPGTMPADMDGVFESGAQTSTAIAIASGAPPVVSTISPEEASPSTAAEITSTPDSLAQDPTAEGTLPVIATNTTAPSIPPTASGPKPGTYTLQQGEFPYCIARRFNVNPNELLNLNGLTVEQARIYEPGLTLKIPQSSATFPAPRALNIHPVSYTTTRVMPLYGVACYFGDVDPNAISSSNTIPNLFNIPAGTTLNIP